MPGEAAPPIVAVLEGRELPFHYSLFLFACREICAIFFLFIFILCYVPLRIRIGKTHTIRKDSRARLTRISSLLFFPPEQPRKPRHYPLRTVDFFL